LIRARKRDLTQQRKRVALVSTPGLIQQATASTVTSCREVDLVATAPGALSATGVLAQAHPDLLLIDATLPEAEVQALLRWVKDHCQGVQCAVITVTSRQRDLALDWGADAAFHRGDLAGHLREVLGCTPGRPEPGQAGAPGME
jgi:DNA-binding NarL/FixJ family response regulator